MEGGAIETNGQGVIMTTKASKHEFGFKYLQATHKPILTKR